MSKQKTTAEFISDLSRVSPTITVIGEYTKAKDKILVGCKNCNHRWRATPNNLLRGKGCPACAGNAKHSHEDFVVAAHKANPNNLILGIYRSRRYPIKTQCKICGHVWNPIGDSLLSGHGCPLCKRTKLSSDKIKPKSVFMNELADINPNITLVSDYFGTNVNSLFSCNICGHKWNATPKNILHGTGCPACSSSRGERQIANVLNNIGVKYVREYTFPDCRIRRLLPFDFFLPDYTICIEFDGIQHYEPVPHFGGVEEFQWRQKKDDFKTKYCQENKIGLIRIPYYEFDNIEQIITSLVTSLVFAGGDFNGRK